MRTFDRRQRGFTYIGLLILIALIGVALASASQVATTELQRDREVELLFVGDQYAKAIESYRAVSPGAAQYPQRLEQLLTDNRFPSVQRHLRRLYPDPMTNRADWQLVMAPEGGIKGIQSRSALKPLKTAGFDSQYAHFAQATTYNQWTFTAQGEVGARTGGDTPGGTATPNSLPTAPMGAPLPQANQ